MGRNASQILLVLNAKCLGLKISFVFLRITQENTFVLIVSFLKRSGYSGIGYIRYITFIE